VSRRGRRWSPRTGVDEPAGIAGALLGHGPEMTGNRQARLPRGDHRSCDNERDNYQRFASEKRHHAATFMSDKRKI